MRLLTLFLPLVVSVCAHADVETLDNPEDQGASPVVLEPVPLKLQRYQGLLSLHTADELASLLMRADAAARKVDYQAENPVALVLHGDEIKLFERRFYSDNKKLVDIAARLDAFNVVDIKVCRRWMAGHEVTVDDLPPFVELVDDGPAEVERLQLEGYVSF